jgi:hypothetical protein
VQVFHQSLQLTGSEEHALVRARVCGKLGGPDRVDRFEIGFAALVVIGAGPESCFAVG